MDLRNEVGRKLAEERGERLAAHHDEIAVKDAALEAEEKKQAEIARLNRPYELTLSLLASRGYEPYGATPVSSTARAKDVKISETFRLRPGVIEVDGQEKTTSLDLKIAATLREPNPGYGDIPGPFQLSLVMHIPSEPDTVHYLTDIHKPILKGSGVPENYGMRTYQVGEKDKYEVNSRVPSEEEATVYIAAIEEAAELAGVYQPGINQE